MSVISNLNTQQTPITSGLTGTQVIKYVPGPRVYIKAVDATPTPVLTKSAGVLPGGWTDLGIVDGVAKVTYTKDTKEVRTGIDQILRSIYTDKKTGTLEFDLTQFDDVVIAGLTGLTPSILTGSIAQFSVGSEDVVSSAILLVVQNKLDGKEQQFYNPSAFLNLQYTTSGDFMIVKGTASLPAFQFNSKLSLFVQTIFP